MNNCFCSNWIITLVAMATYSFHWLIMRKMKIGIYCYLRSDILTKVLEKCSLSSPLLYISFLPIPLNLTGCHGNRKTKFVEKKIQNLLRSHKVISWNFAEMFIILASTKIVFLLPLIWCFGCYGNFKFPLTIMGKVKLAFIAISLEIFWQKVYRNGCWVVLHQTCHFSLNHSNWLVAMAVERPKFTKKVFKNQLLGNCKGDKTET